VAVRKTWENDSGMRIEKGKQKNSRQDASLFLTGSIAREKVKKTEGRQASCGADSLKTEVIKNN